MRSRLNYLMCIQFDLVDLKLFVNIAETNSLTQGARHSYMSAPAASVRIKNVEKRLGTKLLYRTSQGVSLTPAGQAFMCHARLVLQQMERLRDDLRRYADGVKGHLRIVAGSSAIAGSLPGVLCSYLASHNDVTVELRERLSSDIAGAVREGTADIGIVAGEVRTEGLELIPYRRERLVLVAALNHPLAHYKKIGFQESLSFDYVALLENDAIQALLDQAAQLARRPLKISIQVEDCEALCRIVETNVAVAVLPEPAARRYAKTMAIRIIELRDAWAEQHLQICVRDLNSLPIFAKDFVKLLLAGPADAAWKWGMRLPKDLAGIHPIELGRAQARLASS